MIVNPIENGIVLDHIKAEKGMELYKALGLDKLGSTVALIINADSRKMGKKDLSTLILPLISLRIARTKNLLKSSLHRP